MKGFFIMLLVPVIGMAQIGTPQQVATQSKVGKVAPMGSFIAELTYAINPEDSKDTTYILSFRNYKYRTLTQIETIRFSSEGDSMNQLYALCKSVFSDENKKNKDYAVNVTLGKELIQVGQFRQMGTVNCMILIPAGYGVLSESQVDKLFGKN